ncbi:MAG TPA: nucleoside-diphosphate kinase [Jiangellaceae bacterium]|nr:nucleoside-diphosphate kinase [Jiangellaceae bacterium]
MSERTLVLIKPDALSRGLAGEILARYERKGLRIVAMDQRMVSAELSDAHYAEHVSKDFYPSLREFITSAPVLAFVLEGDQAISVVRGLNGATDGRKADPGTVRGDFALSTAENLVHASDSAETAARELDLWFPTLT